MGNLDIDNIAANYETNGYVAPVRLLSKADAAHHRGASPGDRGGCGVCHRGHVVP